ncbi:pyridoxal-phosphate dependent enzyme [Streptomyces sp. OR43]|uniref:pyridoxal-phosphate dependent enzyme n=1 Tax=Streptomyces sp. or43 TaxID=2478957 RepID=UPI0011CDC6D0|nr:pyridoxal-phosphate dependent enzyme [Streptomyces sp. or43]TXS41842.1 pyridoxal-phosphate dependent enzyme [Streptomyces sp. or43]
MTSMTSAVRSADPVRSPVGNTPMVDVSLDVYGTPRRLRLKLESKNPFGSLKDRIAVSLIDHVADRIDKEFGVIESTSGNLGIAMSAECAARGIPFTAVVDLRTSTFFVDRMRGLGAEVRVIDEPDAAGGYLLNRIRYVKEQLELRPGLVWTNQYRSEANPNAHFESTAPELLRQVPGPATVLVPVSTGGTLAGLTRFVEATGTDWHLVGVDVHGSAALGPTSGRRLLSGIGASCPSSFLDPATATVQYVDVAEAVAACLWLSEEAGIGVGGSSGATVAAALRMFRQDPAVEELVCLCPDGADRYRMTIYHADWRIAQGITTAGTGGAVVYRALGESGE